MDPNSMGTFEKSDELYNTKFSANLTEITLSTVTIDTIILCLSLNSDNWCLRLSFKTKGQSNLYFYLLLEILIY